VTEIDVAFLEMLRTASEAICVYLQGHKFPTNSACDIDLSTQQGLRELAVMLAARERKKVDLLLRSFDGKVGTEPSLIDDIESSWAGNE
jgi:hypothetical protein